MDTDPFPAKAMDSLESYAQYLKLAVKKWSLSDLVDVREKWRTDKIPDELRQIVKDEINLRDKINERKDNDG